MKIELEFIHPNDTKERFRVLALTEMYGEPQILVLRRITELMDGPDIHSGDVKAFRLFCPPCMLTVGHEGTVGDARSR